MIHEQGEIMNMIAMLYNRKRNHYSESIVYPGLTMDDFKPELFLKVRNLIRRSEPTFKESRLFETVIPLIKPVHSKLDRHDAVNDAVNDAAGKAVKARLVDELKTIAQNNTALNEIMERFSIQRATAQRDMKLLKKAGFLKFAGPCKTGSYVLTARARALFS